LQDFGYANVTCQNIYESGTTVCNQIVFTITNSAGVNLYYYDEPGGPIYNPLACDPLSSVVEYDCGVGDAAFTSDITTLSFGIQAGSSPQSVPITLAIQFQTSATGFVSLPSYTQTITVPAA
jgi:hypothetical protein